MSSTKAYTASVSSALVASVTAGNFAGPLKGTFIGLYTNQIQVTRDTVLADLVEATYTGYARASAEPWLGPVNLPESGGSALVSARATFQSTGSTVNTVLTGWFLASASTAGTLLMGATFDQPIPLVGATAAFLLTLQSVQDSQELVAQAVVER